MLQKPNRIDKYCLQLSDFLQCTALISWLCLAENLKRQVNYYVTDTQLLFFPFGFLDYSIYEKNSGTYWNSNVDWVFQLWHLRPCFSNTLWFFPLRFLLGFCFSWVCFRRGVLHHLWTDLCNLTVEFCQKPKNLPCSSGFFWKGVVAV